MRYFDNASYFSTSSGNADTAWDYWHHTYSRRILALTGNSAVVAVAQRENGRLRYFAPSGVELSNTDGAAARLERLVDAGGTLSGWRCTAPDLSTEMYNAAGQLVSITSRTGLTQTLSYSNSTTPASVAPRPGLLIAVSDRFGRSLSLTYDTSARLASVTDPAGGLYSYQYDAAGRLAQ